MTTFQHGDIVVHRGRHQYGVYLEPAAPDTAWVMFHGDYDYCSPCLAAVADTLVAAGSRSSLVNAEPQLLPCPACGVDHEPPLHDV